jgi:hypothetical protein
VTDGYRAAAPAPSEQAGSLHEGVVHVEMLPVAESQPTASKPAIRQLTTQLIDAFEAP